MLKQKSKDTLDIIAGDPKVTGTEAYLMTHKETANRQTARTNVHKLLKKPEAQIYLQKHISKARNKMVELVDSKKEDIALRASDSVLDRALGKATQRTETTSTTVNLNLNLSDVTEAERK